MILEVLEIKMEGRKKGNFAFIFPITAFPLLLKVRTEQVRQTLWASTAVPTYASSDVSVREWFFRLFWEERLLPTVLNCITFLHGLLTKKKASAKTALPKSVLTRTEGLLSFMESRT